MRSHGTVSLLHHRHHHIRQIQTSYLGFKHQLYISIYIVLHQQGTSAYTQNSSGISRWLCFFKITNRSPCVYCVRSSKVSLADPQVQSGEVRTL